MRAAAVIQARMGSTRLPGKVLLPLAGQPLLWHVVQRLRKARCLDAIALATSTSPSDDRLVDYARSLGLPVVRGPEDDVLARFSLAARLLEPEIIVRVTGDAPLVDPGIVDLLVERLRATGADFVTGAPGPCIHEGIDPFTRRALDRLVAQASGDPVAREHVSGYFKMHEGFVSAVTLPVPLEHQFAGARISVDTPADLQFLETVYARLGAQPGEADIADVVSLLRADPTLLQINSRVRQKALDQRTFKALIRCDGDAQLGLGHVYRCLALADELRERQGVGVTFAIQRGAQAFERVQGSGYPAARQPSDLSEQEWLDELLERSGADLLVLDVRTDLSRTAVDRWRARGIVTAAIDDGSERRLACDRVFLPPVQQVQSLDWTGFTGKLHCGLEWILLRPQFAHAGPKVWAQGPPRLLIAMGASDPAGLTLTAAQALDTLEDPFEATLLLGPAFAHDERLARWLPTSRGHFTVRRNVDDVAPLMSQSDLAIASFGMTAYELAALGTPALLLALSEDHARSASLLVDAGAAVCLGVHDRISSADLATAAAGLLRSRERRIALSRAAASRIDGRGAERIAEVLTAVMRELRPGRRS
jgi:spore coat polysaccharide biosynthesis protein SpsF